MAENLVLEMILDGISALETKEELEAVKNAAKSVSRSFPNIPIGT